MTQTFKKVTYPKTSYILKCATGGVVSEENVLLTATSIPAKVEGFVIEVVRGNQEIG